MPELNLYRMHLRDGKCIGKHPERSMSYQQHEKKRGWKKCECPIQASGTLGDRFLRKATGRTDWDEARAWAAIRQIANSWDVTAQPITVHIVKVADGPEREVPTTRDAVGLFLAPYEKSGAVGTLRTYRAALNRLASFGAQLDESQRPIALLVVDWKRAIVRAMRDSWLDTRGTRDKYMNIIHIFFRFCIESEWIEDNPADLITQRSRNPEDRGDGAVQKSPFTDVEIERIMEACSRYATRKENGRMKWHGEDLADFVQVALHTGLRISSMCQFNIERLGDDNLCKVRATKNGNWVRHKLPAWLADRMRWRAQKFGPYIFGRSASTDPAAYTRHWRERLEYLFSLCEVDGFKWSKRPTPHRFRHAFARVLLQTPGVELRDVAELLGDTEDVVRRHYKDWVPELQERLNNVMDAAFKDSKPPAYLKPKLVA